MMDRNKLNWYAAALIPFVLAAGAAVLHFCPVSALIPLAACCLPELLILTFSASKLGKAHCTNEFDTAETRNIMQSLTGQCIIEIIGVTIMVCMVLRSSHPAEQQRADSASALLMTLFQPNLPLVMLVVRLLLLENVCRSEPPCQAAKNIRRGILFSIAFLLIQACLWLTHAI